MPLLNDCHSIVASGSSPNFSAHTYTELYAGSNSTPVVNGISITMSAGSSIRLKIRSISNGSGCYLFGENLNVSFQDPNVYPIGP